MLAGLGTQHWGLWWLYLTYGAIGGIGCGMVYVVPGATITKWFPEERGLANGVILAGYGLGSLAFNLAVGSLGEFKRVADSTAEIVQRSQPRGGRRPHVHGIRGGGASRHRDRHADFLLVGIALFDRRRRGRAVDSSAPSEL